MQTQVSLAECLIERQMLSSEEMERVRQLQEEQQAPLSRLVVELGFLSEEDLLPVMRDHFDLPLMSLRDVPNTPLPIDLPANIGDFFKLARMVPVKIDGRDLIVAIADPMELSRLHAIELATGLRVKAVLAKEKEIAARIEALYGGSYTADGTPEEAAQGFDGIAEDEDVAHLRDMASEVPVIRLVNQMLVRALESRASDVHIEPFENQLKVRYRIDGILHEVESPPRQLKGAVISRLKILAQLNIAERRLPQDGRIKTRLGGKDIDLRIATVPTLYGESVVIRLLERGQIFTQLETMGFPPVQLARFNEMILKPHGMILVTGPTGSGKTTTLYGALQKINDPGKKIITIEDPVEYQLGGVNQIHVKPQIGLTFANGLRSIVRQDPDVIMVGEIRDAETAEIAVQAALTGHLVFSTLAYQRCRRRDLAASRDGCAGLSALVVATGRAGAALGAPPLCGVPKRSAVYRTRGRGARDGAGQWPTVAYHLGSGRLRSLQRHWVFGPCRRLRAATGDDGYLQIDQSKGRRQWHPQSRRAAGHAAFARGWLG